MLFSLTNVISLLNYDSEREFVIDSSVGGMGRGAGNLNTELILNYMNDNFGKDYKLEYVMKVMSGVVEPIFRDERWGYSPYLFLTALRRAHPNFATYLLANHKISVADFSEYLKNIPDDMLTKCTRPYVEEMYEKFKGN